jgi:hypothetical protein
MAQPAVTRTSLTVAVAAPVRAKTRCRPLPWMVVAVRPWPSMVRLLVRERELPRG